MENRIQGIYNTSVSNATESHASNMYFLQVKTSSNEEEDAVPLHMVINEQDPQNEQYLIPVLQGKQLQLLIGPRAQATISNLNNQYYYNTAEPQTINADYQILDNGNIINTNQSTLEADTPPEPGRTSALPCNNEKMNEVITTSNSEQKKILQKFVHIADRTVPPRAVATLPAALQLRRGAVSPQRPLLARVRFGPVEGIRCDVSSEEAERLKLELTSSPLFLLTTEKGTTYINVSDKGQSNWISLLQLGDQSTANVWLYQEDHELYAATTKSIPARAPLVLGYSKEYVDAHKLPVEQPVLDLEAELTVKHRQWWCYDCQRSMSSAALLQRHMDVYHTEEKPKPRRYRCLNCTTTFSRLFTLRRHTARHCTKKLKEERNIELPTPADAVVDPSKPDDLADISLNPAEDSRLPSDESLQTLANNLDFSTSLFDMTGSCREEDFNPYSLGLKDDIGLADVDFGMETSSKKEVKTENTETVYLTCRYCRQAVVRGRQRQHVKTCTGRRFLCECGRAFQYRDKLALHIHVDHANLTPEQRKEKSTKQDEMEYKCDTCNHKFKRRGMLVNHLWRVHKTVGTIPLEKKVRHYPCGCCQKLYRTAAKRDHHVRTHHPGSGLSGVGTSIEGGLVACSPAACGACPRQYATRAKLLQHVRHRHPALAPPVKKKISVKREK